jgi:hypothetical protein
MLSPPADNVKTLGRRIEHRLLNEMSLIPVERFSKLLNLKNLKGDSTGYIKVVTGDRLEKGSSLSIDIAPGVRYFNIHIIPEACYQAPRFIFEGMLSPHGCQVSLDVFPDIDLEMDINYLIEDFGPFVEIYNEARAEEDITFRPSRYMHMRAFQSPFFLCTDAPAEVLPRLEDYAERYFDEWQKLLASGRKLGDAETTARRVRRSHIARTIIEQDPDRHMVVNVYGEAVTQSIEEASML